MKATLVNKTNTPFCVQGVLIKPFNRAVAEIPDDFKYDKNILAVIPIIENKPITKVIEPTFIRKVSHDSSVVEDNGDKKVTTSTKKTVAKSNTVKRKKRKNTR